MYIALKAISIAISKYMDAVVAMFVIGIVFMMILPFPTWVVDILIAVNISLSALLVVLALYLPGPLAFSTFPAFLLITTLFRLGLSITTTRLILLQADAGKIVEAFGNFVVGGNLVVGIVIFLILMIVNFLVITKGSERVAEVSARFTLDAMPGKQMSIDSDLRGGLLDAHEAQAKRKSLAKESQLFGAMDGAMKFVKGDAIAGIIIVLVNIIGGYSIGTMQLGLDGGEAIKLYSTLTIGDGLVAQIPALLIALSAGMIITRVKDDVGDKDNVGKELSEQLLSEPKAWVIAGGVLLLFAMVPGMPTITFLALSLVCATVGSISIFLSKSESKRLKSMEEEESIEDGKMDLANFEVYEPLTLVVNTEHYGTPLFDELCTTIRKARNNLVANYGFILPPISFEVRSNIDKNNFQFRFYENIEVNCTLDASKIAVFSSYEDLLVSENIDYCKGISEFDEDGLLWVNKEDVGKLEKHEIFGMECLEVIGYKCREALKKEGYQFVGVDEVKKILIWLGKKSPELAKDIEKIFPMSKLCEIFRNLIRENVSLRSLRKICELVVKNGENERDLIAVTEMVRIGIRDQICSHIASGKVLSACVLDSNVELHLRNNLRKTPMGGYFEIDEEEKEMIVDNLKNICADHFEKSLPIALVVTQDIRPYIKMLTSIDIPNLPVLSFSELSRKTKVEMIGSVSL